MIILTGASASGKSVVARKMMDKYNFEKVVTYTTRLMRVGEENGLDYHFVSVDDFLNMKENNLFIETIFYHNNYYGTAIKDLNGRKILIVDINGANTYYDRLSSKALFIFLQADENIRKQRMINRGDKQPGIDRRLEGDKEEFDFHKMHHIDNIVYTQNKSIEEVAEELYKIYENKIGINDESQKS